jgi:hypothetical protein
MTTSDFLLWIHGRLVNVHGENYHYDYMHRLREVVDVIKKIEDAAKGLSK